MKSIKGLADITASRANVKLAVRNARRNRGKRNALSADMERFMADYDSNVRKVMEILATGDWRISGYRSFTRKEHGKVRNIDWNPSFTDSVVQHALFNTVGRRLNGALIADTYSGIEGRGMHHGMTRLFDRVKSYGGRPLYVFKCDIRHYYESVDTGMLKDKLAAKIKDRIILKLLVTLVDSHPGGLPIGNYLSQMLANFYLNDIDHWAVAEGMDYFRYCDDIVALADCKDRLQAFVAGLEERLGGIGLSLKGTWQIFPIERTNGIDFMGFTVTRTAVRLRKRIERGLRRSARRFSAAPTVHNAQSLMSYYGWTRWLTNGDLLWSSVLGEQAA